MRVPRTTIATLGALLLGCERVPGPTPSDSVFLDGQEVGDLRGANLRETSGITRSQRFPGHYWTHNDSGNDPELFLVDSSGQVQLTLRVAGATNRDWEDIASRGDTLFIAETGDNDAKHDTIFVYALLEPTALTDSIATPIARYGMQYPDGPRDAEALLVDPLSGDWYIVSKREEKSRLYRYAAPQRAGATVTLERVPGEFSFRLAVAGDISSDGSEVLVKTYDAVYYWTRNGSESLATTLMRPPQRQPYTPERQGEAIAFSSDGQYYFTTSEVELDAPQLLLRYSRRVPR